MNLVSNNFNVSRAWNVINSTCTLHQIYNELIRDLLNPGSGFLDLREDQKGVQVAGLSEHSASNTEEVSF